MKILNLDFTRLNHDTFRIAGSKVFYTDPFKISKRDEADFVLLSHEHFDHLSVEDIEKVSGPGTTIIASRSCEEALRDMKVKEKRFLDPNTRYAQESVVIETVPAYNVNKFREPGKPFHPKEQNHLGFIVEMDGTRVYYAGDTDAIPEMQSIRCDIALLPVSGTYVMTPEEAASAAREINPKYAVPMHWGAIVGSEDDARKFQSLVHNCGVEII